MPEISKFYEIIIYMFYNDHAPPHFHVKYQDYEAIVEIDYGIVRGTLPRRAINLIYEWMNCWGTGD